MLLSQWRRCVPPFWMADFVGKGGHSMQVNVVFPKKSAWKKMFKRGNGLSLAQVIGNQKQDLSEMCQAISVGKATSPPYSKVCNYSCGEHHRKAFRERWWSQNILCNAWFRWHEKTVYRSLNRGSEQAATLNPRRQIFLIYDNMLKTICSYTEEQNKGSYKCVISCHLSAPFHRITSLA